MRIADAHIHLDYYKENEVKQILEIPELELLISVSSNLTSSKRNLELSKISSIVRPAFGFHPEQNLPNEDEIYKLIHWMKQHLQQMVAVGEVGLPYYLRKEGKITKKEYENYIELLEMFIKKASKWEKPIVLHAVYEDAPVVCDMLEKYSIQKAQFHWFKGDLKTLNRMMENRYYISVTPEVVYREKIQKLVHAYPIELIMVETDGPWSFEGPFLGEMTNPNMMKKSIDTIADLKRLSKEEVAEIVFKNTNEFFNL